MTRFPFAGSVGEPRVMSLQPSQTPSNCSARLKPSLNIDSSIGDRQALEWSSRPGGSLAHAGIFLCVDCRSGCKQKRGNPEQPHPLDLTVVHSPSFLPELVHSLAQCYYASSFCPYLFLGTP